MPMSRAHFLRHHLSITDSAPIRFRPRLEPLENRCLPSVLTVTSTADSGLGTLRAELAAAQDDDAILFALPNRSTIQLTSGPLVINHTIRILGPGASALTINGNHTFSIFDNLGVGLISGLTISGGGGSAGGGINNTTELLLSHCVISGNQATMGGGIYCSAINGLTNISDCTISNNSATMGGGIDSASTISLT